MSHVICAPLYKGLVNAGDEESMALITRRDPTTDNEISLQRYIQLVQEANPRYPELVQDIVRASTSAMQAMMLGRDGRRVTLASVEGCEQTVGGKQMTGGKIMESIWHSLPAELIGDTPIHIEERSRCTIEEVRLLLQALQGQGEKGAICAVTHSYHEARAARMFREEAPKDVVTQVLTPGSLLDIFERARPPHFNFVRNLAIAGNPSMELQRREEKMEWIYASIHTVSRLGEYVSGFNLEMYLANRARKK